MSTEVICPDCGKVIAPRGSVNDSMRCRCAETAAANVDADSDDISSTEKKCYVCGKSLAGRTRLKDHLGRYWCKECASADERRKRRESELRCGDCGRVFPAKKLTDFQSVRLCATCFKEREKALEKKIVRDNFSKTHLSIELRKLKWLAIAAIGLLLIGFVLQRMFS